MKASEALIAWTPANRKDPIWAGTVGTISIGPLIGENEPDWAEPYSYTGGAAFMHVRDLKGAEAVAQVFIAFNEVVVRDGIPVQAAHEAFLNIDEYASALASDVPGSTMKVD